LSPLNRRILGVGSKEWGVGKETFIFSLCSCVHGVSCLQSTFAPPAPREQKAKHPLTPPFLREVRGDLKGGRILSKSPRIGGFRGHSTIYARGLINILECSSRALWLLPKEVDSRRPDTLIKTRKLPQREPWARGEAELYFQRRPTLQARC